MLNPTGGHGDMRPLSDLPRSSDGPGGAPERADAAAVVDGVAELRFRARKQLQQSRLYVTAARALKDRRASESATRI
jgi:hypothetical protein